MKQIKRLYEISKSSSSDFLILLLRSFYYKLLGKNIIAHEKVIIRGIKNIETNGNLKIGVNYIGFVSPNDTTYLNIQGKLSILGNISIGRGCRFDIGINGRVQLGYDTYINPFTIIICMHELIIGNNCSISWNCQFLDDDFHTLTYLGKKDTLSSGIRVGNKVWIGSNVCIYKGSEIPDGCVVAANSVIKSNFEETNCLIAGNPAKIVRRNVNWE